MGIPGPVSLTEMTMEFPLQTGADGDIAAGRSVFYGVGNEIHYNLAQAHRIGGYHGQVFPNLGDNNLPEFISQRPHNISGLADQ